MDDDIGKKAMYFVKSELGNWRKESKEHVAAALAGQMLMCHSDEDDPDIIDQDTENLFTTLETANMEDVMYAAAASNKFKC